MIRHAVAAGLQAVEWGADVHLRPGDTAVAEKLARRCADAGLRCPSYGSYHAAGEPNSQPLESVLDTAAALGADVVRIWCAWGVEPDAPEKDVARVRDGVATAVEQARDRGLDIALEFHPGTLTATADSTRRLLDRLGADAPLVYWQPIPGQKPDPAVRDLGLLVSDLAHLHVFSWTEDGDRLPLATGRDLWERVLPLAQPTTDRWPAQRVAYLEFVADDDPAQLMHDAAVLRALLDGEREDE